jgi:hypothetical protein
MDLAAISIWITLTDARLGLGRWPTDTVGYEK